MSCTPPLSTGKVPDARRQGVTTEGAYQPYAAGRNHRRRDRMVVRAIDTGYGFSYTSYRPFTE
ncbi:MAG: hypothetical protein MI862_06520 [Desulfobacterales bacterium]|nr:hypothetical protein [Desulfobacterales bacterium]